MKSLERRTQERSQLVTGRGDSLGDSVANFSDYNDNNSNVVDKKSFGYKIKTGTLGLMALGVVSFSGCFTPYDLAGVGLKAAAIKNPHLTMNERIGANIAGDWMFEKGTREEIKNSVNSKRRTSYAQKIPENVYQRDGKWYPAPGYVWISNNPREGVIKKEDYERLMK
jgi:hypothetical protein